MNARSFGRVAAPRAEQQKRARGVSAFAGAVLFSTRQEGETNMIELTLGALLLAGMIYFVAKK